MVAPSDKTFDISFTFIRNAAKIVPVNVAINGVKHSAPTPENVIALPLEATPE